MLRCGEARKGTICLGGHADRAVDGEALSHAAHSTAVRGAGQAIFPCYRTRLQSLVYPRLNLSTPLARVVPTVSVVPDLFAYRPFR